MKLKELKIKSQNSKKKLLHFNFNLFTLLKKNVILLFFFSLNNFVSAQENTTEYKGTITIQKKGQLAKVQFDNVNYRLIGIDQYGNIMDSAVVAFQMSATIRGIFYSEKTEGSWLSPKMQQLMDRCDHPTKLFFDKIKAMDRSGTILDMPKFQYAFGFKEENSY